jgi:hypothetical protein
MVIPCCNIIRSIHYRQQGSRVPSRRLQELGSRYSIHTCLHQSFHIRAFVPYLAHPRRRNHKYVFSCYELIMSLHTEKVIVAYPALPIQLFPFALLYSHRDRILARNVR